MAPTQQLPPKEGDIVTGTVASVEGRRCFLMLPGGFEGRLELDDSLSHRGRSSMDTLPAYAVGRQLTVFVRGLRREAGKVVCYLHERWAQNNPWPDLDLHLEAGNRVTGWVVRTVPGKYGPAHLVQLDVEAPVCDANGDPYEWDDGIRQGLVMQPDIQVLVHPEHMPGKDGSTARIDIGEPAAVPPRMVLDPHEPVAALLLDIHQRPPHEPTASTLALIHHLDAARQQDLQAGQQLQSQDDIEGRRHLRIAQALGAAQADATAVLRGKRIGVLDDVAAARETLMDVLGHYGAEVTPVLPAADGSVWTHAALVQCLKLHLQQAYDLLLVDDGLPSAHDGERALREALQSLRSQADPSARLPLPRVVLISAQTETTEWPHPRLEALGVFGALRRPLSPVALAEVLTAGTPHWEWAPPGAAVWDTAGLATEPAGQLKAMLRQARDHLLQDYAVLLTVAPHGGLGWLAEDGLPPLHARDLADAATKTRLRELAAGLHNELVLAHGKEATGLLRPNDRHVARWRGLLPSANGKPRYLLGVGSPGRDCAAGWPLFCQAVEARLEAMQWHQALHQHAPALATGWMAHGHAHETLGLTETLALQAAGLQARIGHLTNSEGLLPAQGISTLAAKLSATADQISALGRRLLRRQRDRRRPIHLRAWAEELQASLHRPCHDGKLALFLRTPPDLTLALPDAVLSIAVTNLVLNAVKHHYRQENRWVAIHFWRRAEDDHLVCDVSDNGPGISQAVLAHLFEPGLSTATEATQRHGIGLWLSNTLLQQEQGTLRLHRNWRGLGCTFRIELPLLAESAGTTP